MKYPIQSPDDVANLHYNEDGLIPVVTQDEATGAVLMLAWANADALNHALESQRMTYWSRSRKKLWTKGEKSGNTQRLIALAADCDRDALLAVVEQRGPACHEETGTCFTHQIPVATMLGVLDRLAKDRKEEPQGRYTDSLLAEPDLAAAKVEEEAGEVAKVLRGQANEDTLEHEAADLLYHLVTALVAGGSDLEAALRELSKRRT